MGRKRYLVAGAVAGLAALSLVAESAFAGTCQPVTAFARSSDKGKATARATARFNEKKANIGGGRITQSSTTCSKNLGIYTCKVRAVVCPK